MALKSWSTIHIFGYGETQIIVKSDDDSPFSKKKKTTDLTTVEAVVDDIFTHKPDGNSAVKDQYHAINIFNNSDVRFMPKGKDVKGFSVKVSELNAQKLNALISEISA